MAMVKKYKNEPFAVLGVSSIDQGQAGLDKIVRDFNLNYRSAVGGPHIADISPSYQIQTHPTTFLLDSKGVIRYSWEGYVDAEEMTAAVEKLLKEASGKKWGFGRFPDPGRKMTPGPRATGRIYRRISI